MLAIARDSNSLEFPTFTQEELVAIAARHRCAVPELKKRWIIQHGKSYYVMGADGEYKKPIMSQELGQSLMRDLQRVPSAQMGSTASPGIQWYKKKGDELVRRSVEDLLHDYCGHARYAFADMGLQQSWFDPDSETFYEAACQLASVTPVYHEQINTWLQLFCGPKFSKMLDWLATLTQLERPSCGLLITGAPSAGKEMLAQGLARRWKRSKAPTELKRIVNDFNEDLTRCPLVFCDENLPSKNGKRTALLDLRDMVAASSRTLARKFLSNTDLIGAIRLILAANNNRMLEDQGEQTTEDQHATAIRFMHIIVNENPALFLKSIGGRKTTEAWVAGGQIAEHVAWLEKNHEVTSSNDRFIVMGDAVDVQQKLLVNNKYVSLILEWIVRFIIALPEDGMGIGNTQQILIGNGKVLINSTVVSANWSQHVRSDFVPSMTRIGSVLRNLSNGDDRIEWPDKPGKPKEIRYHSINPRYIEEWSKQNLVGSPEDLRARIDRFLDVAKMKEEAAKLATVSALANGSTNGHAKQSKPGGAPEPPLPPTVATAHRLLNS